jgi:hypothetical protein
MSLEKRQTEMRITVSSGAHVQNVQQIVVNRPSGVGLIPFRVPPLPPYFIPRPEVEAQLTKSLCEKTAASGILVAGAVHGIGGLGKSTLAARLAHAPNVQSRFPDGIIWTTLGQDPDLPTRLSDWINELGDYDFQVTDIESATGHLRTLLRGKACLLVIDDAWHANDVKPFLVAGAPSQILITTRIADIARLVGADLFNLDVMSPEQSLELLARRLNRGLDQRERENAGALAKTLGYLPLALQLAAAQIASGASWTEIQNDISCEVARLEKLKVAGRLSEYGASSEQLKDYSLLASFNLSVRRLDDVSRLRFAWLGILAEDASFDPVICSTVWGTSANDAAETLAYLSDKALLYEVSTPREGRRQYRIHDLLHDTARILLTSSTTPDPVLDMECYGIPLKDGHQILLLNYLKTSKSPNIWHSIPDDGYSHSYMTWHIAKSSDPKQIHCLLSEDGVDGRNGWFGCRESRGQIANFVRDVAQAMELIRAPSGPGETKVLWRYLLMLTSLNSLAERLPSYLITQLVEEKMWTAPQALAYIRRMSKAKEKARALTSMLYASELSAEEKSIVCEEALAAASSANHYGYGLLIGIAKGCEPSRRLDICKTIWRDKQKPTRDIVKDFEQLDTIKHFVDKFADFILGDIQKNVSDKQGRYHDALVENLETLAKLANYSPEIIKKDILEAAKAASDAVFELGRTHSRYRSYRENIVVAHVAYLEIAQRCGQNVKINRSSLRLRTISDRVKRATLQLRLARMSHDPDQSHMLIDDAMESLQQIGQKMECVSTICCMASQFNEGQAKKLLSHALSVAKSLDRATERAKYLAMLCRVIASGSELADLAKSLALDAAGSIKEQDSRCIAICDLAISLGGPSTWEELGDPLALTEGIISLDIRLSKLCSLAACFPAGQRSRILSLAVATVNELRDYDAQALALVSCAEHLTGLRREETIKTCISLVDKAIITKPENCVKVIEKLVSLGLDRHSVRSLANLSRRITDHGLRVSALVAVAKCLPPNETGKITLEAYRAVKRISKRAREDHYDGIFKALSRVAPLLTEAMLQEAIDDIRKVKWLHEYIDNSQSLGTAQWLRCLAERLISFPHLWDIAVEIASALNDNTHYYDDGAWYHHYKDYALCELVRHAPKSRLTQATRLALSCRGSSDVHGHDESNLRMLASLAARIEGETREQILEELLDAARITNGRGSIFDEQTAKELYQRLLTKESDWEVPEEHYVNIYDWTEDDCKTNILNWLKKKSPGSWKHVVASQDKRLNVSSNKDATLSNLYIFTYAHKERQHLLNNASTQVDGVFREFGEDGIWTMTAAIKENAVWWP